MLINNVQLNQLYSNVCVNCHNNNIIMTCSIKKGSELS